MLRLVIIILFLSFGIRSFITMPIMVTFASTVVLLKQVLIFTLLLLIIVLFSRMKILSIILAVLLHLPTLTIVIRLIVLCFTLTLSFILSTILKSITIGLFYHIKWLKIFVQLLNSYAYELSITIVGSLLPLF